MVVSGIFYWSRLYHLIWSLAFLVDKDDDGKDEDLGQHAQKRPQWGEVAAHPHNGGGSSGADAVGGVTLVVPRVRGNVQVQNV